MLLTVKKQIEETVEIKTPAYYKNYIGNFSHINEAGQLITVRKQMINISDSDHGKHYADEVQELLREGQPCTKEEFEKAYAETMAKLNIAVGAVEVNS
jgi:hypothetical protein